MIIQEYDILGTAKLTAYRLDNVHLEADDTYRVRPAVVVLPGGGYCCLSEREAEPIAMQFLSRGFDAFVLRYSVMVKFPQSLMETAASIRLIRQNAAQWEIDPNKIVVCGFSAGGHLAGTMAVFWHHQFLNELLGSKPEEIQPNGAILSYAVLSSRYAHQGSFQNLLMDEVEEKKELVSVDLQVTEKTAPCFLWHTFEDPTVPVEGAISMMMALKLHNVPFEAHIWPKGTHGIAVCTPETYLKGMEKNYPCAEWFNQAARWIREL